MVVSGVPTPIDDHASQVARFALELHKYCSGDLFRVRHLPNEALRLRIGLHSGW